MIPVPLCVTERDRVLRMAYDGDLLRRVRWYLRIHGLVQ